MSKRASSVVTLHEEHPSIVTAKVLRPAFRVQRCKHGWEFVKYYLNTDEQVEDVIRSEPNMKAIIIDQFKIAAFKDWSAQ